MPTVRPGARRPTRSSWLTPSRLSRIGWASSTSRSRSDTLVPVWLIASAGQPLARAWSTSPGEQASIPTPSGVPGSPMPRSTARIRGSGQALSAKRVTYGQAGAPQRGLERAHRLHGTVEVVDEQRGAVLAQEHLEVGTVNREPAADDVEARPAPPRRGRRRQQRGCSGHGRGHPRRPPGAAGTIAVTRCGRQRRDGPCARSAADGQRGSHAGQPDRRTDPVPPRRASRSRQAGAR